MRNPHELYSLYSQHGVLPGMQPDEARSLARVLIGSEQYQTAAHPDHAIVTGDVRALYEMANPTTEEQQ
jgi:hypothetical protein